MYKPSREFYLQVQTSTQCMGRERGYYNEYNDVGTPEIMMLNNPD